MDSHIDISGVIKIASETFSKMLDDFHLGESEATGFPERNLSFQFGHAFLQSYRGALVFQEVTFNSKEHLDTLLVNAGCAIALECKALLNERRAQSLRDDIERLEDTVIPRMKTRFRRDPPSKWFTVVLCEAWDEEIARWWKDTDSNCSIRTRSPRLDKYTRDYILLRDDIVYKGGRKKPWSLYWLYAYREIPL